MQPNTVTLAVDYLNTGVNTDETYTRFDEQQNRSTYIGASHNPDNRDTLSLYRSFPTKSGNFKGVQKTSFKFSKDHVVTGVDGTNLTVPAIVEVSFSVPVGLSDANILKMRQRVLALIDRDEVMVPLNSQLMI